MKTVTELVLAQRMEQLLKADNDEQLNRLSDRSDVEDDDDMLAINQSVSQPMDRTYQSISQPIK